MTEKRLYGIDMIKLLALGGVILFHLSENICKYGYLGVDIFLVFSGFFCMRSINKQIDKSCFSPLRFLLRKIQQFLPSILVISAISLLIGCVCLIPDDLENLAESIIASIFFSNNILLWITSKSYWDINNMLKPLMHLWYLGVLMEYYVVAAFTFKAVDLYSKPQNKKRNQVCVVALSIAISLAVYFLPRLSSNDVFYLLPARVFELSMGALVALVSEMHSKTLRRNDTLIVLKKWMDGAFVGILVCLLFVNYSLGDAKFRLLFVCIIATWLTFSFGIIGDQSQVFDNSRLLQLLATWGAHTFEVYLTHQVVFAFAKLLFSNISFATGTFLIALSVLLAVLLNNYSSLVRVLQKTRPQAYLTEMVAISILLCTISGVIYSRFGVIRDVPELNISATNLVKNFNPNYCGRVYDMDVDFRSESKKHVLCVGNSFARDFANVLLESDYSDEIEVSYFKMDLPNTDLTTDSAIKRFNEADIIFYTSDVTPFPIPDFGNNNSKLYIVGNKRFGLSNSKVYSRRFLKGYFDTRVPVDVVFLEQNKMLTELYGDRFVDMMTPLLVNDEIAVFTDTGKFISHDCKHLTQPGAEYYARILNLEMILQIHNGD